MHTFLLCRHLNAYCSLHGRASSFLDYVSTSVLDRKILKWKRKLKNVLLLWTNGIHTFITHEYILSYWIQKTLCIVQNAQRSCYTLVQPFGMICLSSLHSPTTQIKINLLLFHHSEIPFDCAKYCVVSIRKIENANSVCVRMQKFDTKRTPCKL